MSSSRLYTGAFLFRTEIKKGQKETPKPPPPGPLSPDYGRGAVGVVGNGTTKEHDGVNSFVNELYRSPIEVFYLSLT